MKKKIFCFFASIFILFNSCFLIAYAEESPYDEHIYSEDPNVICGTYNGRFKWWVDTKKNTCGVVMNDKVVKNVDNLKKYDSEFDEMTISDGIIQIGECAFKGLDVKTVNFPKSVTEIKKEAFKDCINLETFEFKKTLEIIDDGAFQNCDSIEKLVLPQSVKYIGKNAFEGCDSLCEVFIYSDEIVIDEGAFDNCPKLRIAKFYGDELEIKNGNDKIEALLSTTFFESAVAIAAAVVLSGLAVLAYIICVRISNKNKEEIENDDNE